VIIVLDYAALRLAFRGGARAATGALAYLHLDL
jgi:energy-converting hydrogenase Eha subunit G